MNIGFSLEDGNYRIYINHELTCSLILYMQGRVEATHREREKFSGLFCLSFLI